MIFFFKKKILNVDCFAFRQSVIDLYPIDYSYKFLPEWWKSLPKSYTKANFPGPIPTMRSCAGFIDFHRQGMMIPLWSDIAITLERNTRNLIHRFSDGISSGVQHEYKQMSGFLNQNEFFHIKLQTPWLFKCKENVPFSWIGNMWALQNPNEIIIPPAVVNYKHNIISDINMFVHFTNQNQTILLKQGTPIVNIIPHTDKKLKITIQNVTQQEFMRIKEMSAPSSFLNKYRIQKNIREKKENENRKCPFHFGK